MDTPAPIRRRLVCYLSGFDPQGPAHYQQLYATEGAKQATVGGYKLTVGKRRKQSEHIAFWDVRQDSEDGVVETRYEFLRWDDIVRQHWPRGRAALLGRTVFASWHMWRNGVMWRTLKTSWPIFIAAAVPGGLVLVFAVLVLALLVVTVWWALQGLWPTATASLVVGFPLLAWAAAVAERRSHMGWLMRSFACLVKQGKGQTPELEARLDMFGAHVAQQVRIKRFDEVLVVGHSSGAMMAMAVMARALAALPTSNEDASPSAPISLLTLGHCTPLLSGQAEAAGFRSELQALRTHQRLCWVDYGAPPDGCCFPLSDPTAACGVADSGDNVPKLLNPRFAQLFSATRYQHVRRDKFRCHFQYLMASEVAGSYDYFAITAGPQSLAQRHASLNGVRDFKQFQCFGGPLL
jgi:hypothetical protein